MENFRKKWLLVAVVGLFLCSLCASPVSAELNTFLVKASDGSFYEYNSADLNNSYLSTQINPGGPGGNMYLHFNGLLQASGKVIGLGDTVKGYMDYPGTALALLKHQMWGIQFDINAYFASDDGVKLKEQVYNVKVVDKNGNVSGGGGVTPGDQSYTLNSNQKEFLVSSSSEKVQFTVAVPGGADSVTLMVSETNSVIDNMLDDGKYSSSGDDLQGDGIYSASVLLDLSQEKDYQYYAQVTKNGQVSTTEVVAVRVIMGLTDVEINAMTAVEEPVATLISSDDFKALTLQQKADQATALLESFGTATLNTAAVGESGTIVSDSIMVDLENKIVTYEYSSGVLAAIMLEPFAESEGPITQSQSEDISADLLDTQINQPVAVQENNQQTVTPMEQREEVDNSAPATTIESVQEDSNVINTAATGVGDALFLYAFDDTQNSWRYPHYISAENKFDGLGLNTSIDADVTVQDFKEKLDDGYEVIVFSMHGSTYTSPSKIEYPVLCTIDKTSFTEDENYSADLKNKRLIKYFNWNNWSWEYWILPSFFDFYYDSDDLKNSLVLMENCDGMGKDGKIDYKLTDSLTGSGAETVIGFHNSVWAVYCRDLIFDVMNQMVQGKTAQESLNHAINEYGKTDEIWYKKIVADHPAAYPILNGNGSFKLVQSDFKNGGFENTPILTGWNRTGDVRVLNKIGSLTPTQGQQMAFISTGIGSKEDQYLEGTEGSILSQTFTVPATAKTITLSYDVLSEEPMEYVGSKYDDQFTAELIGSNGQVLKVLSNESVNSSTWLPLAGINFDGGDYTTYHTGWKSATNIDISGYAGQSVTLRFKVWDKGDSKYDTAVLIDGITIK